MGLTRVTAGIGLDGDSLREMEFLVDTGSFYTFLPPGLAQAMGISLPVRSEVVLADSSRATVSLGVAYLRVMDREGGVLVGAMDVPMPLLGASALEALGLKVDPVREVLEHSRPFGPAVL